MSHRRHRHHVEGIEEVRERWGDQAARAAELHVMIDMGHIPTMEDWEKGGIARPSGEWDAMDAMGLLDSSLETLPSGLIVSTATAYGARLPCSGCNDETLQLLTDIRAGEFTCSRCRSGNVDPSYRIEIRPKGETDDGPLAQR